METEGVKVDAGDLKKLIRDVAIIKKYVISEREEELSDWAKKELAEARKTPDSENISLEELEKRILKR